MTPQKRGSTPACAESESAGTVLFSPSGTWTMMTSAAIEKLADAVAARTDIKTVAISLKEIAQLDTLGALVITRAKTALEANGATVTLQDVSDNQQSLLNQAVLEPLPVPKGRGSTMVDGLADVGKGVSDIGRDFVGGVSFLGALVAALGRVLLNPAKFRLAPFVKQMEIVGFRSVPIVALISFLVGGIIAQQSVFQLRNFGTTAFVADLMGVLVLRELGVLLTAIMIAGRSGSAITAEIGSMKMREEIDALRTMGRDPMEVLIVPRILALVAAMPILTFIGSMSGLFGGGLVAWIYGDVSPDVYLSRLQSIIQINTFMVGMIKAPVMALVIGLIAAIEGLKVQGSAESLGRQTTASVVKAIFMVIVVDGLFAMFFASIQY